MGTPAWVEGRRCGGGEGGWENDKESNEREVEGWGWEVKKSGGMWRDGSGRKMKWRDGREREREETRV